MPLFIDNALSAKNKLLSPLFLLPDIKLEHLAVEMKFLPKRIFNGIDPRAMHVGLGNGVKP